MDAPELSDAPETTETATREQSGDLFAARRARFMEQLGPKAGALFVANPTRNRSNDTNFDYRPNSDLLYLTGFEEPDAVALFLPEHKKHPFVLFLRDRDLAKEAWDGARLGVERAGEVVGCDKAFPIGEIHEHLPKLLVGRSTLVYGLGINEDFDRHVIRSVKTAQRLTRRGRKSMQSILEPEGLLHEMRLIKSPEEIDAVRRACQISALGHVRGMRQTRPGMSEFELQAEIEYVFKRNGAKSPGYPSIVGSGSNACVLHYIENRDFLNDGDLVLVDAGAEVDYYTGDVTRTWPVSGSFNGYQREVYDLVLRSQMAVIRMVKPGVPWHKLHETSVRVIAEGLLDMGILEGSLDDVIKEKTYQKFSMHGTGHWLGIDVHDVGSYARAGEPGRPLEPGCRPQRRS